MPEPRTFIVALPDGMRLLNANQRPHWREKAAVIREIRLAAWAIARRDKIPQVDQAKITVTYHPPFRRTRARDAGNWAPSGKAAIDGLRDAAVFADDDSSHVVAEEYRIGAPRGRGQLVITITEVLEAAA